MAILTKQESLNLIRDKKSSPPKFAGGGTSKCGLKEVSKKKK
jgi:hypothetical protein